MVYHSKTKTLYVDGQWREGTGSGHEVVNPATEDRLDTIPSAGDAEVAAALEAAKKAQRDWGRRSPVERSGFLRQIAEVLKGNVDSLAHTIVREVGKPLSQAKEEVTNAASNCIYMAEWDRRIEGDIVASDRAGEVIHLMRVPIGVVAAITPWNYPVELFFRKVAPALVTGNTVVLKPSEVTPLSSIQVMQLIEENVDLPKGVLNLVTGGRETGKAMVRSPLTNMVSMTGHRDSGKAIMREAADHLTRVALELGGSAPAIVWRDADIGQAVDALILSRHANSGQVCTCSERIYVHKDVLDQFLQRYTSAAGALRLGDPMGTVDMGPLVSKRQYDKVERAVRRAQEQGAKLVLGGGRPTDKSLAKGYWYAPTVFTDVQPGMDILRDETFGPVSPILPVETLEEALHEANDTRYGLSAYVFTNDYRLAMRATQELEFGEIYLNRPMGEALQAHHIGHKESGLGGEDGKYGMLKYTQLKSVYHCYS
jgi:lactaldehyde dehydrogenase/glycolaldehyde dehydrogenase